MSQFAVDVVDGMTPAEIDRNSRFVSSLTKAERKCLWAHVFRYDGVEGVSAKEQSKKLVQYVLNFFNSDSPIYVKAMRIAFGEPAPGAPEPEPAKKRKKPSAPKPAKKKRKMSPWVQHVRAYYQKRKEEDPDYLYRDAMRDARATYAKKVAAKPVAAKPVAGPDVYVNKGGMVFVLKPISKSAQTKLLAGAFKLGASLEEEDPWHVPCLMCDFGKEMSDEFAHKKVGTVELFDITIRNPPYVSEDLRGWFKTEPRSV